MRSGWAQTLEHRRRASVLAREDPASALLVTLRLYLAVLAQVISAPRNRHSLRLAAPCCLPCREQLIGLTDVTRSHFTKLVDEMEKGLDVALQSYDSGGDGAVAVVAFTGTRPRASVFGPACSCGL